MDFTQDLEKMAANYLGEGTVFKDIEDEEKATAACGEQ
jgi:hypothetical protein